MLYFMHYCLIQMKDSFPHSIKIAVKHVQLLKFMVRKKQFMQNCLICSALLKQ